MNGAGTVCQALGIKPSPWLSKESGLLPHVEDSLMNLDDRKNLGSSAQLT